MFSGMCSLTSYSCVFHDILVMPKVLLNIHVDLAGTKMEY